MSSRRTLSRRDLLRAAGLLGTAAFMPGLSSCAKQSVSTLKMGEKQLRIDNWSEYIDDSTVNRFLAESGIRVDYVEEFEDNTVVFESILQPALEARRSTGFDIVCPTFWMADRLISSDSVEQLPLEFIPNHVNLDVPFLRQPFDRGALYNLPWQSGITGIATNTKMAAPVRSVRELLTRDDLKGRVNFLAEMRDSIGLALLSQGKAPSATTLDEALSALTILKAGRASGHIRTIASGADSLAALEKGEIVASVAWSGDIAQLQKRRPEFEFHIAEEGGMQWFDTMVIPKYSLNGRAAAEWMNFVYQPENAARITSAVQYISPVIGTQEELAKLGAEGERLANNPLLFPDLDTRRRLHTWHGTSESDEDRLGVELDWITKG